MAIHNRFLRSASWKIIRKMQQKCQWKQKHNMKNTKERNTSQNLFWTFAYSLLILLMFLCVIKSVSPSFFPLALIVWYSTHNNTYNILHYPIWTWKWVELEWRIWARATRLLQAAVEGRSNPIRTPFLYMDKKTWVESTHFGRNEYEKVSTLLEVAPTFDPVSVCIKYTSSRFHRLNATYKWNRIQRTKFFHTRCFMTILLFWITISEKQCE